MAKKICITSALPYANGPLHFGHIAGAYLPADCYARFERMEGSDVLFLSGSDEYGIAITLSAEQAGRSPQEHVEIFHKKNLKLFETLSISFDFYGRTTGPKHAETTIDFFRVLEKKGYIEKKKEDHLYSEKEGRFLADRYVVGICPKCGFDKARGDECPSCASSYEACELKNPRSKVSGSSLTLRPSEHLYLRFDSFRKPLLEWIEKKSWKPSVIKHALYYIKELKPRAITRDSDWGVPVPGEKGKVFYVWFDAPIGYISIAKQWAENRGKKDLWKDFWLDPDAELVHFIGKDNIPFHTVFFPAMLMGQDLPYKLPDEVPANEFLNLEGKQFSKSDGWYIDLEDFFTKYSSEQLRYYLAANAPETSDAEFSWKDFQLRSNGELLGKFGNFINRVLVFVSKHLGGKTPMGGTIDREFKKKMEALVEGIRQSYRGFHLRKACSYLMELAQEGNIFFDTNKPWVLAKDPKKKEALLSVFTSCIECIKALALMAFPILPKSAEKIWKMLGMTTRIKEARYQEALKTPVSQGQKLGEIEILFRKIEDEEVEKEVELLGKVTEEKTFAPIKKKIDFEQFLETDLRIGQILSASSVPKSKKLLVLEVDLGIEKRTIVSGIALRYRPDDLIGKKVLVVANLAPVKIMGIESSGMILAAVDREELELPGLKNLPAGSIVS